MCGRGHAWQGVCIGWGGACMAGGVHGRGHVWWGAMHGGGAGGMHGRGRHAWQGACMVGVMRGRGGMHGRGVCVAGGHVWQGGMHGRGCAWQIPRDTVNEWVVRILLECMLVIYSSFSRGCLEQSEADILYTM